VFARRGIFPVYPLAARIDNCNFSQRTLWEQPANQHGRQFFAEATDLGFLSSAAYDFVLSSHMLEHSANPLKALREWLRVLKPGGTLLLVLPHREGTFDHRRPVTSLQHLVDDFERQVGEDDLTHLAEILQLHDLRRDPGAGDFESFKARCENNSANRGLHHHVFNTRLAIKLLDHLGVQIRAVQCMQPFHIALVATRLGSAQQADNRSFLGPRAPYRGTSPFRADR
jgi:SAM-dependent methyltransferase